MTRTPATSDPLILTLEMDAQTFAHFDGLRRRHFPAALNHIPAHVTLFHHLPGLDEAGITETVAALARTQAPPEVAVTGLRFLGRGVAYGLDAPGLSAFRGRLAHEFASVLTAQDAQGWRPHVTIQNKVTAGVARALLAEREAAFAPFTFTAPGLVLWRYLGGPWERRAAFAFGENR
ncbi:2'-5' RNA ligase family protein [Methylobacterium sp. Leaf100]|jgi:2'-5' RNA ligase|uniref:2'-5' RNA ligase family protein n=1 Tax=Methylobacterium sp. Leaf100 TaxID=1736252 RepID=UPI0006FC0AD0|nr:2'-5' RNA ligase family protein [Methylobacterium sp. Leaf100]KQP18843.1 phosphoesterase HXTX [Methylobacterium sp. Leaf100]